MVFKELSQILAEVGVSSSQKEHILTSNINWSTALEEENHEEPEDLPRETKRLWIVLDEEKPLEADIEEHQPNPTCTLEDEHRRLEDLHDIPNFFNKSNNQEYMDSIESLFHMTVSIHRSLIIQ